MDGNRTPPARVMPVALAILGAAVALVVACAVLKVVFLVMGPTALVFLGGLGGCIAVVVLAVLRRRPVSLD